MMRFLIALACLGSLLATSDAWLLAHRERAQIESVKKGLPRLERDAEYVSSDTCRACHPAEYDSWLRTYHRTMTQVATPENVLGDFDGSTVTSHGLQYTVSRDGGAFYANMPHPDEVMYAIQGGKPTPMDQIERVDARVVMTTGSHHYQTYWVESPTYGKLLQTLPLVYLKKDQRWIPREAAFMNPPNERTSYITQWNHHCIRCHSTGGSPGLDPATGELRSEVGELGIACESCHGPAEAHVAFHRNPLHRYSHRTSDTGDATIVNPAKLDAKKSSETCGQCHGVYITRDEYAMTFAREGVQYRPGKDLDTFRYYIQHPAASRNPEDAANLERNPEFYAQRWWPDGTILAGGREYTAMTVTGCYLEGEMSCLSCHTMHGGDPKDQLIPGMTEQQMCVQCHDAPRFTSDLQKHTHHAPDSSGSSCLNCHMPHKAYALLGAVRSHQIDAPNLGSSAEFGVPNACNLCHLDQTLEWTNRHLTERWGYDSVDLSEEQRTISAALLWLLQGDAAQRAVTAWAFGWGPAQQASEAEWMAPFLSFLLMDPYGVVRYVAKEAMGSLPGFADMEFDFLAERETLRNRWRAALDEWVRRGTLRPEFHREELLIGPKGSLKQKRILELLNTRNNRPVAISE